MGPVALAPPPPAVLPRPSRLARVWSAPLRVHAAALGLVLIAVLAFIGDPTSLTSDSGVAVVQARSLAGGEGWTVDHPFPEVDPDGRHFPIEKADRGEKGAAPFAKHPFYVVLLAAAAWVGGVPAMVGLSIAGTVAAAVLAAALASRIDPAAARPALWAVGVASPLFFDSYMVIAHSVAAGAGAAAVLVALRAMERRRVGLALVVGPLVAVAVLLRSEAVFLAVGLAVVGAVLAVRSRPAWPFVAVAGVSLAAALVARLAEAAWIGRILGGSPKLAAPFTSSGAGYLSGRVDGLRMTWFTPTYSGEARIALPLLVMLAAAAVAAHSARRRPAAQPGVLIAGAVAASAALIALFTAPDNLVPGLLVAFPLAVVGVFCLTRADVERLDAQVPLGVAAVFAACVLATQYSVGGGVEWGGRYFALAIPLVVPVLCVAIRRQGGTLGRVTRRGAVVALGVCTFAMTAMAVGSLRSSENLRSRVVGEIERAAAATEDERPVVVTTGFSMAALLWPTLDDHRWLFSSPADVGPLAQRIADAGVDRFVLLTFDRARDEPRMGPFTVSAAEGGADGRGRQVLVLSR